MFAYSCILHIEHVDQEYVAVEEEATAEDQEEQPLQELEAVNQVEDQDPSDYTNSDQQPGKHRFIYPRVFHKFKFGASPGSLIPFKFRLYANTGSINPVSYLSLNFSLTLPTCAFKLLGIV